MHEGRVKVGTNRDGAVLFFTRTGRILVDVPERSRPMPGSSRDAGLAPVPAENPSLLPVPAESPSLPPIPTAELGSLSNGAALYRDSAVPWAVEAVAREAVEESFQPG